MKNADALDAEAFELEARAAQLHAEAARMRAASATTPTGAPEWLPVAQSPLGRRRTLELARTGEIESSKIGRGVFVKGSSLRAYLDSHRRGAAPVAEGEDLFDAVRRAS